MSAANHPKEAIQISRSDGVKHDLISIIGRADSGALHTISSVQSGQKPALGKLTSQAVLSDTAYRRCVLG